MTTDLYSLSIGPALSLKLATDPTAGRIEGYASIFGELDMAGDVVEPGAFAKSLRQRRPAMIWQHNDEQVIGRWDEYGEDDRGLRMRGTLNLDTTAGREAHAHIKAGDVTGLSIGYRVAPGGAERKASGIRHLTEIDVFEVSPVTIPCCDGARIVSAKGLTSPRELETILHKSGLARGAAAKIAAAGWQALKGDQDQPDLNSLEARIKAATAEIRSTKG